MHFDKFYFGDFRIDRYSGATAAEVAKWATSQRALFSLRFDSKVVVYGDYRHSEWGPSIVPHNGKRSRLVTAQHRVLVIRGVHHHVRMPMTNSRPEILVRREHIRERHHLHSR
jgi:hypothetical protein